MTPRDQWPVWDWPVRIIHWYFPVAIAFMWWSGEEGKMEWHSWVGYSLLVAALTRILWGFIGSHYARFSEFLRGPGEVIAYLKGKPFVGVGHNPLGGWSTVALLLLVVLQAGSGLFSNDDIMFEAPLAYWAGDLSASITEFHELNWTVLSTFILLHLAAIAFYHFVKKRNLVAPMVRGQAPGKVSDVAPRSPIMAVVVALVLGAMLSAIIMVAPEAPSYY